MDQADRGGRQALGQSHGRGTIWGLLFYDHRLSRFARFRRSNLSGGDCPQGAEGRLRPQRALPECGNRRALLALCRPGMGLYFCILLSMVGGRMAEVGQQHPIGIYLKIWVLLFILSGFSYMVDILHLEGLLRWSLILLFMFLKAGLIVAVFMHMMWERLALVYTILLPPLCLLVLVGLMAVEADYTFLTRE